MECSGKIGERVRQLIDETDILDEQEKYKEARDLLFEAWDLLPDEKYEYNESYWIVAFILSYSLQLHDLDVANQWAYKILKCDLERQDDGDREMRLAIVLHESGKMDEAKKYFKIAFQKSEGRCFVDEDAKYLAVIIE